ncbi:hypothetical protein [Winogradskyella sediminis]|uniref:hypothetical protein n=1 Tax=Winogradskyella sediminis TaxID=1382466 RepID=UPI000E27184E|nr:hypothetical protein [Winogradskyella sediminis]REG87558.1 hypothetical protein C8N41_102397 [Winogradskyella sediminis]
MKTLIFLLLLFPLHGLGQEQTNSEIFWEQLKTHCGKAYEGVVTAGGKEGDGFTGKSLVMHVRSCDTDTIRIPFFVGDDKSRTWVLHINDDKILGLKHDHRHKDGTEEELTQYGGTSVNQGLPYLQMFPADVHTSSIIPAASSNVWWFTIDDTSFTYNLRRIGTDRLFSVRFDITKTIETPEAPWGIED